MCMQVHHYQLSHSQDQTAMHPHASSHRDWTARSKLHSKQKKALYYILQK